MNLFENFLKQKDGENESSPCADLAKKFKKCYEEINDVSPIKKEELIVELTHTINSWSQSCSDDANYHLAQILYAHVMDYPIDADKTFDRATKTLKPMDGGLYSWFKKTAESFITPKSDVRNFTYLNDLISRGEKEIKLDSDIIVEVSELFRFPTGIHIEADNLVIDGCNHCIDGGNKSNIFAIKGKNVHLKNITFKNARFKEIGAAVANLESGTLIENCNFKNNHADNQGGSILNIAEIKIVNCSFTQNSSNKGGAIFSTVNSNSEIIDSEFVDNEATEFGGAIFNEGSVKIIDCGFKENSGELGGGIYNSNQLTVTKCEFEENKSQNSGGAIVSGKDSKISHSIFKNNHSEAGGGALAFGSEADTTIFKCTFHDNDAENFGGAIFKSSSGKLIINESRFIHNSSGAFGGFLCQTGGSTTTYGCELRDNFARHNGGALMSHSEFELVDSIFDNNNCNGSGASISNPGDGKILNCEFKNHDTSKSIVSNEGYMECIDTNFKDNKCDSVIFNAESANMSISTSGFENNSSLKSSIYNLGDNCSIEKTNFADNVCEMEFCADIYNETSLSLKKVTFSDSKETVLNKGEINIKRLTQTVIDTKIHDLGKLNVSDIDRGDTKFNFNYLNELIHGNEKSVSLTEDIFLIDDELEFYGGGIELDIDDLVIEGNDRIIDSGNESRIFYVTGKNITLKNITFKNGDFKSIKNDHIDGGGAIRIVTGASLNLIDCKFIDNNSQGYGGAILNNGTLKSTNSLFENNSSKYCGGAIYNGYRMGSEKDVFKNNESSLGSSIYNQYFAHINDINLLFNPSNMLESIFNNNIIETKDCVDNIDYLIYNCAKVNENDVPSQTFSYLIDEMEGSSEVLLSEDIIFNYILDYNFKKGITIDKDLVIDGRGHFIDGNFHDFSFKIEDSNVTFKNIIFKNFHSKYGSVFDNDGHTIFDNCKFINCRISEGNTLIDNKKTLTISNSVFSANISKTNSIIYNNRYLKIIKSDFIFNGMLDNKNLIVNFGRMDLNSSKFINNYTYGVDAIINNFNDAYLNMDNNKFIGNYSYGLSGVLTNSGQCYLTNSKFSKNSSKNGAGTIQNSGKFKVEDSTFTHNNTQTLGGAIVNQGEFELDNSKFNDNYSKHYGGAIGNYSHFKITGSIFNKNNAGDGGGAIYNHNEAVFIIMDCEFNENLPADIANKGIIRENDDEPSQSNNTFAKDFKAIFERMMQGEEDAMFELLDILNQWRDEYPNDFNMKCADLLVNGPHMSMENFMEIANELPQLKPVDDSLYDWYKNLLPSIFESKASKNN
jgi:predicted outer membrane repeat protein